MNDVFNLQMFGDDDTITSATQGKFNFGFTDGDSRIVTLPNVKTNLGETDVTTLNTWVETNQPIIGDKTGASTTGIFDAYILDTTKVQLDLS